LSQTLRCPRRCKGDAARVHMRWCRALLWVVRMPMGVLQGVFVASICLLPADRDTRRVVLCGGTSHNDIQQAWRH